MELQKVQEQVRAEEEKMSQNREIRKLDEATAEIKAKMSENATRWSSMHESIDAVVKSYEDELQRHITFEDSAGASPNRSFRSIIFNTPELHKSSP